MANQRATTPLLDRLPGLLDQFHFNSCTMPEVRRNEFDFLFETAKVGNPKRILEFLAENTEVAERYPQSSIKVADLFITESMRLRGVEKTDWSLSGIENCSVDLILSLAPIHHATDSEQLMWFSACHRVLRPGGELAFAEVGHGSRLHHFLDGFVNDHTPTGHTGNYLKTDIVSILETVKFASVTTIAHDVTWRFSNQQHMADFLAAALAINHSSSAIIDAATKELGTKQVREFTYLNWPLVYVRAVKS